MYNRPINTSSDVFDFVMWIIKTKNVNFHPDTDFNDYVCIGSGVPTFSEREVIHYNKLLEICFEVCNREQTDIYSPFSLKKKKELTPKMHQDDINFLRHIMSKSEEDGETYEMDLANALYLIHNILIRISVKADAKHLELLDQFALILNSNFGLSECEEFTEILNIMDPNYYKVFVKALCDL